MTTRMGWTTVCGDCGKHGPEAVTSPEAKQAALEAGWSIGGKHEDRPRSEDYCPACRFLFAGAGEQRGGEVELAPPAFAALAFLIVAAIAWALVVRESRSSGDMGMGLGSFESFTASWVVMMAAIMLPSAMPLVFEFGRNAEGRRGWQAATGMLGATYLSIWLAFGIACYLVVSALPMSWTDERLAGGLALALAGVYGLTPLKRASEARCRELCALHGPLPFNLMRSAVFVGAK